MERSSLDLAIYAYIDKHLTNRSVNRSFPLEHATPWKSTSSHAGKTNLRIHLLAPEATEFNGNSILDGLGDNDHAVVFVDEKFQADGFSDQRVTLVRYSDENLDISAIENALASQNIKMTNIAQVETRIGKTALLEDGVVEFLQKMETHFGERKVPLDMFLLLPFPDQVNVLIPIKARNLSRTMDFERLARRLLDMQA